MLPVALSRAPCPCSQSVCRSTGKGIRTLPSQIGAQSGEKKSLAISPRRTKNENVPLPLVDEGRKRVLGIIAGILIARHLKTTEDLFDGRPSPRTEAMVRKTLAPGSLRGLASSH